VELWDINEIDDPAAATRRLAFVLDMRPHGVELRGLVLPSGAAPLHIASNCRHPAVVGLLIRQLAERAADLDAVWQPGFDPDHQAIGLTPLLAATGNPNADASVAAIRELLAVGADIRVLAAQHPHETALVMAALRHAAALESLLAAGANVHFKDADGSTALHHAVRYRNEFGGGRQVVTALLAAGADPLAVCATGMTPRRWA
jgi:ankyrin repeat protein